MDEHDPGTVIARRHGLVESRMRGDTHVRFGGAGRGTRSSERPIPRPGPTPTRPALWPGSDTMVTGAPASPCSRRTCSGVEEGGKVTELGPVRLRPHTYESASPRSARPTATATAAEPAPGSAGRSHRPRRTISAGPEPHLLAFDRRQSDNVGDIPRSGRCLPIRTCGAAVLDSAAHPRLCAVSGSSGRGGEDGSPDPGSRWPVRPDPTAPGAIAWLRCRDWRASNLT
jgi:hypothetical protein